MQKILIKNRIIKQNEKPFLIAELGLSHEGSLGIAIKMIDEVIKAGADAVKFQMHLFDYESSNKEKFRVKFSPQDKTRQDYWKRTSFSIDEWIKIKKYCQKKNIIFLCSPFSLQAVEILHSLKVDAWKIASGEMNNLLMIDTILKKSKKPIILSTGLSYEKEIREIVKHIKRKNSQLVLLQCVSSYPSLLNNAGHNLIIEFNKKFKTLSGMSDHTGSLNSLISSVFFGASIIETHVTYSKNYFGPDSQSSITFEELSFLKKFIEDFYIIKKSIVKKKINSNQKKLRLIFNKGLAINKNITKGKKIIKNDLLDLKPMTGIPSYEYKKVIGKFLNKDKKKKEFLHWKDFEKK